MTDRRRMVIVDQHSGAFVTNDGMQMLQKSNRPVSWHPSTQFGPQPVYHHTPITCPSTNNEYQIFDLPPTPTVYSGYTSPSSTFSPLSMPFTGYDQQQYSYVDAPMRYPSSDHIALHREESTQQQAPTYTSTPCDNSDSTMYSHFDWSNFAVNGFERSTAPPTPENFLPIQHPDPTFPTDDAIPYHSLADSTQEEEGEILCGMGLYDNPDVGKAVPSDPQLDNYRSSMIPQMFGSKYVREPTGKGLKLEETWNPPASDHDDEDDDDDDDERDGEGEQDEETTTDANPNEAPRHLMASGIHNTGGTFTQNTNYPSQNYDRISWL